VGVHLLDRHAPPEALVLAQESSHRKAAAMPPLSSSLRMR
jgi:hypothetical protein